MKHKTWFRLVLKAIGIYMIAMAIPGMVRVLSEFFRMYTAQGGLGTWATPFTLPEHILYLTLSPVIQIIIGAYLVFGGKFIVNMCIPSNRPYCPECGYDLSQSRGEKCAECGVTLPNSTKE